jgi:hypothetical protein
MFTNLSELTKKSIELDALWHERELLRLKTHRNEVDKENVVQLSIKMLKVRRVISRMEHESALELQKKRYGKPDSPIPDQKHNRALFENCTRLNR